MPIDQALLAAHRRIERPDQGISEEFVDASLGGTRTVATLYRPLGEVGPAGWVICHSLGMEQTFLMEHEVAAARALAAAGMAALRYQGSGYGEAEGDARSIGLRSHLADAADAVRLLAEVPGIDRVGVIGGRLGGTVAALTAEREGMGAMALWEPVTSGARYMRDLLRVRVISDMGSASSGPPAVAETPPADPAGELAAQGWSDVKGFILTAQAHRDISEVDLLRDLRGFRGDALVASPSRSGTASSGALRLAEHLRALGGRCDEVVVRDDEGGNFGMYHYGSVEDLDTKIDLQAALQAKLAEATTMWCAGRSGAMDGPPSRP
jgi:hypothetical protein